jgi:hypothetical protein
VAKEIKFFRKQAAKAEQAARAMSDIEASESLFNLAGAYRNQAATLKMAKKKSNKKKHR